MKKRIAFFDTKPYDKKSFDQYLGNYDFEVTYFEAKLTEKMAVALHDFDAVCAFVNDEITDKVIDTLEGFGIKILALRCAGYNNVDIKSAYKRLTVVRVPAYSPYAVAEHTVALLLTLNRKTHKAFSRTRDGNFSINGFVGFDMHGKTAGVVGTGKIGQALISILQGFGMRVIAYDKFPNEEYAKQTGITFVDMDTLYKESDVISLHCPLNDETTHMINNDSISTMKDGVIILNTGRGKLINTKDLIDGLKSGKIGGAGLDVYEEEDKYFFEDFSGELITDDVLARLLTFPNVLITSHQAFLTKEALGNIAEVTLNNIREYFEGGYLPNEICYQCDDVCSKKLNKRCF